MKYPIKALAAFLALILAVTLCACVKSEVPDTGKSAKDTENVGAESSGKPEESKAETADPSGTDPGETAQAQTDKPYSVVSLKEAGVGDVVAIGSYEQDGNAANGKEPLEWLVLEKDGDSLLVITLYAVEKMQFHSSLEKVTWETSAVRAWLNGAFLDAAFAESERSRIRTSEIVAEKNPDYPNSPAGNDTEDKVFLLSIQEAERYFEDNSARMCSPTEAAVASEPSAFSRPSRLPWYASGDGMSCSWWLRSPGMFKDLYVSYVGDYGNTASGGQVFLSGTDLCVRPAMRITVG